MTAASKKTWPVHIPELPAPTEHLPVGEYLTDEIAARGLTPAQFAHMIDVPVDRLSAILMDGAIVKAAEFHRIAAVTGTDTGTWMRLQTGYIRWLAMKNQPALFDD